MSQGKSTSRKSLEQAQDVSSAWAGLKERSFLDFFQGGWRNSQFGRLKTFKHSSPESLGPLGLQLGPKKAQNLLGAKRFRGNSDFLPFGTPGQGLKLFGFGCRTKGYLRKRTSPGV